MLAFNTKLVSRLTKVTPRQLGYWDTTGLIKPSVNPATGTGSQRLYSFQDIVQIRTAKALRDQGISLQKIRKCVAYLRKHAPELEHPLANLKLITDGETLFCLTADSDVIIDTLRHGQLVLSVVAIGKLVHELRAKAETLTLPIHETVIVGEFEYQVILTPDTEDGGYVVECPAIKGCVSQGETKAEALRMIKDAIELCFEVLEERKANAKVA